MPSHLKHCFQNACYVEVKREKELGHYYLVLNSVSFRLYQCFNLTHHSDSWHHHRHREAHATTPSPLGGKIPDLYEQQEMCHVVPTQYHMWCHVNKRNHALQSSGDILAATLFPLIAFSGIFSCILRKMKAL